MDPESAERGPDSFRSMDCDRLTKDKTVQISVEAKKQAGTIWFYVEKGSGLSDK
jgi:hypothetical protein